MSLALPGYGLGYGNGSSIVPGSDGLSNMYSGNSRAMTPGIGALPVAQYMAPQAQQDMARETKYFDQLSFNGRAPDIAQKYYGSLGNMDSQTGGIGRNLAQDSAVNAFKQDIPRMPQGGPAFLEMQGINDAGFDFSKLRGPVDASMFGTGSKYNVGNAFENGNVYGFQIDPFSGEVAGRNSLVDVNSYARRGQAAIDPSGPNLYKNYIDALSRYGYSDTGAANRAYLSASGISPTTLNGAGGQGIFGHEAMYNYQPGSGMRWI